ncbi:MAG: hypothetical protein AAB767_01220 [Patescibacteria group bacterium]
MLESPPDFSVEHSKLRGDVSNERILAPAVSALELERLCDGDEHLSKLLQSTFAQCARYTEDVARFLQIEAKGHEAKETGEYHEIDKKRALTHNATIDSINILARELSRYGRDGSWVKTLSGNRVAYMKFALTLTFDRMKPSK